mmetsp:Transcript_15004/g.31422  ORF Transcript_15004/g.31422 Transcript_15004/m.31422 type:complete len:622 (-) Transcript_15004:275-2140(-)
MHRVRVLSQQVAIVGDNPMDSIATTALGCPMQKAGTPASGSHKVKEVVQRIQASGDEREQRKLLVEEIQKSGDRLMADGTWPLLSMFDAGITTGHEGDVPTKEELSQMLKEGLFSEGFEAVNILPGPWKLAETCDEKVSLMHELATAEAQGYSMFLYMRYMQQYGDAGLASNIVVPQLTFYGTGSEMKRELCSRVLIGNPSDAERISRVHTRKEGNFCPVLYDSVIATPDNEYWQEQRRHLAEAFLPLSSLAEILPKSLDRAKGCAERLAGAAIDGQVVDMNDFLLHEAQAQLQLALLGCPEAFMEATNKAIRSTFQGEPGGAEVGALTSAMQEIMARTTSEPSFALPSDGRPVCGPLSRAVGTSELPGSANFGNMLLILFAGHDTTGHTMTWLLFELARHPEIQHELQREVDAFFKALGGRDPTYRDLSNLTFMDRCITETLRLWPAVPNGTFRRLQFDETVTGPEGKEVLLPRGTAVQIANWPRHRNPELWGVDADSFNPKRAFLPEEMARVGCPMAAVNPQSKRFSPFAHAPRSCLGRNFAQLEMRLIMLYLLQRFEFKLAPPYDQLMGVETGVLPGVLEFRGINRGTMGPMNLDGGVKCSWGQRHTTAMKMYAQPRA